MVGAVVVCAGRELASAYHHRCGEAHAEVLALSVAGDAARGADLYVSLEPCAHQGRTPPCVEAIVAAGIARVVIPALDPDPRVRGWGVAWLRSRGVRVEVGCDASAAVLDNHGYYHDRLGRTTTVTLKMATSSDGMIARAPGRRDPVTGDAALLDVHRLRAVHDAIVVGIETASIDRPRLDCRRLPDGVDREPTPVVLDTTLRLPADNAWAAAGREYIVVTGVNADAGRARAIEATGGRVIRCERSGDGIRIAHAIERLAEIGFARILIEGGARVFRSALAEEAWDAAWLYHADTEFGPGGVVLAGIDADRVALALGAAVDETRIGDDVRRRHARAGSWNDLVSRLAARTEPGGDEPADVHGHR